MPVPYGLPAYGLSLWEEIRWAHYAYDPGDKGGDLRHAVPQDRLGHIT